MTAPAAVLTDYTAERKGAAPQQFSNPYDAMAALVCEKRCYTGTPKAPGRRK
jgi:hypothetical protein